MCAEKTVRENILYMRLLLILICVIFVSCKQKDNKERNLQFWSMIKSGNVDSIIEATIGIQQSKDTSMIGALLYGADDPRITHKLRYKGMSVYQIKMGALRNLTGLNPPTEISYKVDTAIISYYRSELLK